MFDDIGDIGPARGDAGDRRNMVDLKRVLHAQQKPEPQNSKHAQPALLRRSHSSTWIGDHTGGMRNTCRCDLRLRRHHGYLSRLRGKLE
jgi:hypothetical protein